MCVEMKRSKSSEERPSLTAAPGKYKLGNERGCHIPAKHLSVNCPLIVVRAEMLHSSSYSTSQLDEVTPTLKLDFRLLAFTNLGM